jgi:hypothetical protein
VTRETRAFDVSVKVMVTLFMVIRNNICSAITGLYATGKSGNVSSGHIATVSPKATVALFTTSIGARKNLEPTLSGMFCAQQTRARSLRTRD